MTPPEPITTAPAAPTPPDARGARTLRIDAAALATPTAAGTLLECAPAALLLREDAAGRTVLFAGLPAALDAALRAGNLPVPDERLPLPTSTVLPGLVNTHCHLDLTHLGPLPHDPADGFDHWLARVRAGRAADPDTIAASVRRGVELSLAGGVVAVGDIAGCPPTGPTVLPWQIARDAGLLGVSFVEFFAIGAMEARSLARLDALVQHHLPVFTDAPHDRLRLGLQPHAPYSVSPAAYRHAAALAERHTMPLATHLAESLAERSFIADNTGPKRAFLESLGLWNGDLDRDFGHGRTPAAHAAPLLSGRPWLLAHCNDLTDADIALLARTGASVVFCARAHRYFGFDWELGPHRFADLLAAGVNVCLGTDSILNLDTPERITPLDDARLLFGARLAEARTLLEMLTVRGAAALGLDPARARLDAGSRPAGVVAVEGAGSLAGVLGGDGAVRPVCGPGMDSRPSA